MPIDFYGKSGGTWRKVDPAKGLHYKNGSSWQEVDEAYYKSSGSWKKVYQKSDPITYTMGLNGFSTHPSRFARGTSWGVSSNGPAGGTDDLETIACGRYFTGSSTKRYYGLMNFAFAAAAGETTELLANKLAVRPVVTSATLRLTRDSATHGVASPTSGSIYISPYNGSTTDAAPDPADVDFSKATSAQSVVGLTRGSDITISLDQDIIDDLASTGTIAVTNVNSGLDNSGSSLDQSYMWFLGIENTTDASKQPLITVTLDYS